MLILLLALMLGGAAVWVTQSLIQQELETERQRQIAQLEAERANDDGAEKAETIELVVAAQPIRYGMRLTRDLVKTVSWPESSIPVGAFRSADELLDVEQPRVALYPIQVNEPVLASNMTGPGGRASLSALIEDGMRAMTIRVDDVTGVAGFVLPGDRVDVLLTRTPEEAGGRPATDVLLQNVKVLGVGQSANQEQEGAQVVSAVTLEVTPQQAQKLVLAGRVGSLSLALRNIAQTDAQRVRRVAVQDLNVGEAIIRESGAEAVTLGEADPQPEAEVDEAAEQDVAAEPEPAPRPTTRTTTTATRPSGSVIGITRGTSRKEVRVPEAKPDRRRPPAGGTPVDLLPEGESANQANEQ